MRIVGTALLISALALAGCGGGGGGGGGGDREEPSPDLRSGPLLFSNVAFPPRTAFNFAADFDEDGLQDLLLLPWQPASASSSNSVYLRRGSASELFGELEEIDSSIFANDGAVIADFTGDNHLDVVLGRAALFMLPGNGDGTFDPEVTIDALAGNPVIRTPMAVDLDSDGDQDIVGLVSNVVAPAVPFIAAYLNNGAGVFSRVDSAVPDGQALAGTPVDFDADGELDLLVATDGSPREIRVCFGVGGGMFAAPASPASPISDEHNAVSGDLNGDGNPDIVVFGATTLFEVTYRTLLGAGNGSFSALSQQASGVGLFPPGSPSYQLADLTSDGMPDLIVNARTLGHSYFEGNGDGTFNAATLIARTDAMYTIIHDLTGDGINDAYASVLISGNVGGIFNTVPAFDTGTDAVSYVTTDLNGDAFDDLAIVNDSLRSYISNGDNTFTLTSTNAIPIGGLVSNSVYTYSADFNGDTLLDIAVLAGSFGVDAAVYLNQGDTTLAPAGTVDFGGENHLTEMAPPADLDGDGNLDLFGRDREFASLLELSASSVWVAFGNGDGTFQAVVRPFSDLSSIPQSIDLDNDGLRSLVFHDLDDALVRIFHTQSNRTFTAGATLPGTTDDTDDPIAIGLLDADALEDLVVLETGDDLSVYYGNASNGVDTGQTFNLISGTGDSSVRIVDSGTPLILHARRIAGGSVDYRATVTVLERTGTRTFSSASSVDCNAGVGGNTYVGDLNADGETDLLTPWDDMVEILRGQSGGSFQSPLYFDLTTESGSDVLALGDWDGDGDTDIAIHDGTNVLLANNQWF